MKSIIKVFLLTILFAGANTSFAQWSFSMSFSYVGRDCGNLHSIEATINQRLRAYTAGVQYPTRELCMSERSTVQSIINEINNTYNVNGIRGFDCKLVWTLGGCIGNDMSSNTLQLGVSKDAAFQSSNPANEVNDWVALHDSLIAIMGAPTKYMEPLDQTAHINDFIEGLDQIEHVYSPQETYYGKPEERIIPDNYKLATDHDAPTMPTFDYEEEIIVSPTRKHPAIPFDGEFFPEPVKLPEDNSGIDDSWFDVGGDVIKTAWDVGAIVAGIGSGTVLLAAVTTNVIIEDAKALYKGIWKGEIVSTKEILGNALKKSGWDAVETVFHGSLAKGFEKVGGLSKSSLSSVLSISTRAAGYLGKAIGHTDISDE